MHGEVMIMINVFMIHDTGTFMPRIYLIALIVVGWRLLVGELCKFDVQSVSQAKEKVKIKKRKRKKRKGKMVSS